MSLLAWQLISFQWWIVFPLSRWTTACLSTQLQKDIEETEEPEINCQHSVIMKKAREFQKNIYFYFIDYTKALVWITANYGKFLKRWEYHTTLPVSWETCMQVKKQQLEPDMKQWLV